MNLPPSNHLRFAVNPLPTSFLVAVLAGAFFLPSAHAATLFLRQGVAIEVDGASIGSNYTGTHDAELRESSPDGNFNHGTGSSDPEFKLDVESGLSSQVVVRFDNLIGFGIGQVPPGATINSATLFIDIDNTGNNFQVYRASPSVPAWTETAVTWNNFGSGSGGVTVGTDTAGSALTGPGGGNKVYLDVITIVDAWAQGAANRGFAFLPGGTDAVDFDASENSDLDDRPSLTVNYTVSNPLAPSFNSDPIAGAAASATHTYTGDIAPSVTDPDSDPLTFSKVGGPAWLSVATNGALSGTPGLGDMGGNRFTVHVTDNEDGSDAAALDVFVNDEDGNPPANTARYRLVWVNDPSTTITVCWEQTSGAAGAVHYGTTDEGTNHAGYPSSKSADRQINYRGMENCFARLTGLSPDTVYYFVIKDATGTSPRFWFRTASSAPEGFSFVAGGDSRNNRTPRQRANRLIAKLRPLFVAFTGDMINSDTSTEWQEWLDDWQQSITSDGRIIPLLPHRGNHETGGNTTLYNLFDITTTNYYAVSFGGNLLRYYVLNSESDEGGTQKTWLNGDLTANAATHTHLAAGYHKPMRPHTTDKSEGSAEYSAWAEIFDNHDVDLVCESDSHTMKRTQPIVPFTGAGHDEGFIQASGSTHGTVYIGEGCWGAPLRSADDNKDWTLASGSFNGFDLIHVYPDRMENYTVQVDNEPSVGELREGEELALPEGIGLWQPAAGAMLMIGNSPASVAESYAAWQLTVAGGSVPANLRPYDDYDGDGAGNLLERVLGFDPMTFDQGSAVSARVESGPTVYVEFTVDPEVEGTFDIQTSDDLGNFTTLVKDVDYTLTSSPDGALSKIAAEIIGAYGTVPPSGRRFFRIKVSP